MKNIVLIFLAALFTYSCEDALEEVPKNFLSPSNYYNTAEHADAAILSAYKKNTRSATTQMIEAEHSDYVIGRGSWLPMNIFNIPLNTTSVNRTNSYYKKLYRVINEANIVLSRVPEISMNEAEKKKILAEALFLRGRAYFELVKSWGAVPLRLNETVDLSELAFPRTPVNEVYAQVLSDLSIAETDLPADVGVNTGRASKWAAKMLLANVYLNMEDWANAASKAEEVINSNMYSLVTVEKETDFYKIFASETCSEDIFSYHYSPIQTLFRGFIQQLHYANTPGYNENSKGWYCCRVNVNSPLINNWDTLDLRCQFNIYSGYYDHNGEWVENASETPLLFKKFIKDQDGYATHTVIDFRYAEAFLVYAEAVCMAGGSPTALALERLNIIKRRGYGYADVYSNTPDDYPAGMSKDEFRSVVIKERAYEFMLENRRFWDLKRTNTIKQVMNEAKGVDFLDSRLLYPIPQDEIANNPSISQADQNLGY